MKRPRHLHALPEVVEIGDVTDMNVRAAFIVRFGPQCAAWLCNRFRRQIRRRGSFRLHLPKGATLPPWTDIALSYLKKRDRWLVEEATQSGVRTFCVTWKGDSRVRRVLPASIKKHSN